MRILLLLAGLAVAAGAQAQFRMPSFDINKMVETVKNVGKAVKEIDEPEEIAIGKDVASRLLGAAPLVADARMQRYVNHVGRWLAAQTERPDLPWQFGVLESPNVNAFAVPGGTIFITRGLLERMRNEAELAGVLGHEIVHVLRKHHLKAIQKGAQSSLAGDAMSMALKDRAGPARDKLIAFGTEMYSRGLVIAARGGYDAYGLPSVLQTLQAISAQDSAIALMFKTHPAPGERLDALSEKMQPVLDAYASQPQLAERFVRQIKITK
jgi:predicted Zn-dependent protease